MFILVTLKLIFKQWCGYTTTCYFISTLFFSWLHPHESASWLRYDRRGFRLPNEPVYSVPEWWLHLQHGTKYRLPRSSVHWLLNANRWYRVFPWSVLQYATPATLVVPTRCQQECQQGCQVTANAIKINAHDYYIHCDVLIIRSCDQSW